MQTIPVQLLHAFVIFNESRNTVEAAARLHITQPALSKQLKAFEAMMPSNVFTFAGRKKVLTSFGIELHRALKARLSDLQTVVEDVWKLHADAEFAKIRIAARRGVLDRIATRVKFKGAIFFDELSNDEILRSLLDMKSEIGIVYAIPDTSELVVKPLFKEVFQIVIPKRMFSKTPIFGEKLKRDLIELPCVGYRPDDEILNSVLGVMGGHPQPKLVRTTENYASLAEMVETGIGWAVLPTYISISKSKNWEIALPAPLSSARQFYLAYRTGFSSVAWFKELLREIRICFE